MVPSLEHWNQETGIQRAFVHVENTMETRMSPLIRGVSSDTVSP